MDSIYTALTWAMMGGRPECVSAYPPMSSLFSPPVSSRDMYA